MWKIKLNNITLNSSPTLADALKYAKDYGEFVVITDDITEIVGKFGVDTINNNICPDGVEYSWTKRREPC